MTGKIGIEGIKIFAYHGYYEAERQIGREFILDIYIELAHNAAGNSDQLADTIDYVEVLQICKEEMAITSKLLEHVCTRIAQRIKALTINDIVVKVRMSKIAPYLPIQLDRFFVEITV